LNNLKHIIPIKILPFNNQGFHIMVTGELNKYKFHMLIDTGATLTVVDINRAKTIFKNPEMKIYDKFFMGIGTSKIDTYSMHIDLLYLANCKLEDLEVILIDMENINKAYAAFDLPRVDGIIGGDILQKYKAVINYEKAILELSL
jgi:predicted aspartyl protease